MEEGEDISAGEEDDAPGLRSKRNPNTALMTPPAPTRAAKGPRCALMLEASMLNVNMLCRVTATPSPFKQKVLFRASARLASMALDDDPDRRCHTLLLGV
jgi:hypothetical protein